MTVRSQLQSFLSAALRYLRGGSQVYEEGVEWFSDFTEDLLGFLTRFTDLYNIHQAYYCIINFFK